MLKPAYFYQDQLLKLEQLEIEDKYHYYDTSSYIRYHHLIEDNEWNYVQRVSVNKKNQVIGYISCSVNQVTKIASGLGIINYYQPNITFSRDVLLFIQQILQTYRKINFSATAGNPAILQYQKCNRFNVRYVGTQSNEVVKPDGSIHNLELYEIFPLNEKITHDKVYCNPNTLVQDKT